MHMMATSRAVRHVTGDIPDVTKKRKVLGVRDALDSERDSICRHSTCRKRRTPRRTSVLCSLWG